MSEEVTRGEIEDIIRNFAAENAEYRQRSSRQPFRGSLAPDGC